MRRIDAQPQWCSTGTNFFADPMTAPNQF